MIPFELSAPSFPSLTQAIPSMWNEGNRVSITVKSMSCNGSRFAQSKPTDEQPVGPYVASPVTACPSECRIPLLSCTTRAKNKNKLPRRGKFPRVLLHLLEYIGTTHSVGRLHGKGTAASVTVGVRRGRPAGRGVGGAGGGCWAQCAVRHIFCSSASLPISPFRGARLGYLCAWLCRGHGRLDRVMS